MLLNFGLVLFSECHFQILRMLESSNKKLPVGLIKIQAHMTIEHLTV